MDEASSDPGARSVQSCLDVEYRVDQMTASGFGAHTQTLAVMCEAVVSDLKTLCLLLCCRECEVARGSRSVHKKIFPWSKD
mmetsp:Transcript_29838/g.79365  ORF Transcript_29838/g.79365 Transcript_29838/m.79365 type:complete len:81 (-) Transcript_29838:83-325(-)